MEVDSEHYKKLEKSIHGLTELHLRQFCEGSSCDYGSPAGVCHKLVEQVGVNEAQAKLDEYRKAHADADDDFEDDFEQGVCLPIPVRFLEVQGVYPPGQLLQCTIKLDTGFIKSVSRRDWIGLFEVGWKYLNSYITFEWARLDLTGTDTMTINFAARTLPSTEKKEQHVLCYVTRAGDVLGVSTPFFFKRPGLSFTDPDTFLVDEESMPTMDSQATPEILSLNPGTSGSYGAASGSYASSSIASGSITTGNSEVSPVSPEELDISMITMDNLYIEDLGQTTREKDELIEAQKVTISQLTVQTEQQQAREDEQWETSNALTKNIQMLKIKNEELRTVKEGLESSLEQGLANTDRIRQQNEEKIRRMKLDHDQKTRELELLINELTDKVQGDVKSSGNDEVLELQRKIQILEVYNTNYQEELAKCKSDNAEVENLQRSASSEVPKLEAFIRAKDGIIKKLTSNNQIAAEIAKSNESKLYAISKENEKFRDDYRRLNNDMTDILKKYKASEDKLHDKDCKIRKLSEDLAQMKQLNAELNKRDVSSDVAKLQAKCQQYEHKLQLQEREMSEHLAKLQFIEKKHAEETLHFKAEASKAQFQLKDLQNVKVGQDEELRQVTIISLHARIAQLEKQVEDSPSISDTLQSEYEGVRRELAETQENEMNFRAGIKDLRTQLVSLTLQIDQKNELLADKGELIDTLRLECQERQEREKFAKHRTALCERKLQEEGESYMQIISDLQSQLTGYANAHIQP